MHTRIFTLLSILALWALSACYKVLPFEGFTVENATRGRIAFRPANLSYGANLFFIAPGLPPTVAPTSKPATAGYFRAIPQGLVIDSATGTIQLAQSMTGMAYKVFYLSMQGAVLDSTRIVVSGISYKDSIYRVNLTPNRYDTAFPIYNANPNLPLPCSSDDDDDDDEGCIFDETDLDGDGDDDIEGVIQEKLLVNKKTGTIDVEASLRAGIFGSDNPANGSKKDFTMYYRLNDASNRSLNSITLQVHYYATMADIPATVMSTFQSHATIDTRIDASGRGGTSFIDFDTYAKPRRPPMIIIVGQ